MQSTTCLLGAAAGDVIGSVYEHHPVRHEKFPLFQPRCRFTDDTVLTLAVANAILEDQDYAAHILAYGQAYPDAGYGGHFRRWLQTDGQQPYNSFGNGSAMRVSAVGWAFDSMEDVLREARRSAEVTHNHPEGIKGAQAVALAVFLARSGETKEAIRAEITERFGYDLERSVAEIRPTYRFDVTCQGSVPEAIVAFLESSEFEDAVRKAISLGGDADTQAAIAGSIAEAFYGGVPARIASQVSQRLPQGFREVIQRFSERFCRQL